MTKLILAALAALLIGATAMAMRPGVWMPVHRNDSRSDTCPLTFYVPSGDGYVMMMDMQMRYNGTNNCDGRWLRRYRIGTPRKAVYGAWSTADALGPVKGGTWSATTYYDCNRLFDSATDDYGTGRYNVHGTSTNGSTLTWSLGAAAAGATHICVVAIKASGQGTIAIDHAPDGTNYTDAVASGVSIANATTIAQAELCYALGTPLTASSKIRVTTTGICRLGYVIAYWDATAPSSGDQCFVPYATSTILGMDEKESICAAQNLKVNSVSKYFGGESHNEDASTNSAKLRYGTSPRYTSEVWTRFDEAGDPEEFAFVGGYQEGFVSWSQTGVIYHTVTTYPDIGDATETWSFSGSVATFSVVLAFNQAVAVGRSYWGACARFADSIACRDSNGTSWTWTSDDDDAFPITGTESAKWVEYSDPTDTVPLTLRITHVSQATTHVDPWERTWGVCQYGDVGSPGTNDKSWFLLLPKDDEDTYADGEGRTLTMSVEWRSKSKQTRVGVSGIADLSVSQIGLP